MTGRRRIRAAFDRTPLDRVPVDFGGHRSSGIAAAAYARLREYLALPQRPLRVYDPIQQLAIIDDDVLDLFDIDTIELGRAFARDDACWNDWRLPDGTPCQMPAWATPEKDSTDWVMRSQSGRIIARMPAGALYFEQVYFPFAENIPKTFTPEVIQQALGECMWTAIASPPGPLVAGPDGQTRLSQTAQQFRQSTDRAIIALFGGNLLEVGQFLFRNDNFFILLAGQPDRAHAFLDCLLEMHLDNLRAFLDAVGDHVDVVVFGDDLGMQSGPQLSPAMYREFFKPRHEKMWRYVRTCSNAKTNLHSCGGIYELLGDLIDAGLEAVNPVQITCQNMELARLKRDFGKSIVFWGGGCDTRDMLQNATPQQIRRHVHEQIVVGSTDGGFVFQQVHNILANVPPQNIVAMLETARDTHT